MQENKTFNVFFPLDQSKFEYLHHILPASIKVDGDFVFHVDDKSGC